MIGGVLEIDVYVDVDLEHSVSVPLWLGMIWEKWNIDIAMSVVHTVRSLVAAHSLR